MARHAGTHRILRAFVEGRPEWLLARGSGAFLLPEGPYGADPPVGRRIGAPGELQLLAPTVPTKIIGIGRNYVAHAAEHGVEVPAEPLLFLKPPSSLLDPDGTIVAPALSERVEYEGELALVIGRRCKAVAEPEAWAHVLGVTCGIDVTARDLQRADPQWTRGKGFDTFCPLGPWIAAGLDEAEAAALQLETRVNGVRRQQASTGEMVFPPARLIAYITQVMTLEPGDVILTGTPEGVGRLAAGDSIEVEIAGVGVLRSTVR
ncbi:MAG TPA: fumarylacetoacetate hydrolase family protein [Thermoanaerobaculales bacterium]|nr:fumarylacetoacetate hydrolase family protein [Thermoanaerobaculales bacterium]HPA80011.1 fumarylacetoacetate hydrolase family protein [Thermoanaerobaculales bacterium]HQL30316.1 fumarylacetoacetate hydrolase family protein [Thermoanaerobaculales bacterium]HQN95301.1 fumarylacetoacetate hydrolase family protein [Thermoanaerobaculales bacterium]HQP42332.1 fumarylacetoacetate hydrolase family protein [Thermoanaerobaculales bacterium]